MPGPPYSMFWLTCAPHLPAMVRKMSLADAPGRSAAGQVVADRLADAEPCLAGGDGVQHVGPADAARRAIEGTGTAGVRVGVHQDGAGQCVGPVGDDGMADALVGADIVQPLDAEFLREVTAGLHACGGLRGGRRDKVVEDDHHLRRIGDLQHLAPAFGQERQVDQARGLDVDHDDIARGHSRRSAGARQNFFGDCHAHGCPPAAIARHCHRSWRSVQERPDPAGPAADSLAPGMLCAALPGCSAVETPDDGDRLGTALQRFADGTRLAPDLRQQQTVRRQHDRIRRQRLLIRAFAAARVPDAPPIGTLVDRGNDERPLFGNRTCHAIGDAAQGEWLDQISVAPALRARSTCSASPLAVSRITGSSGSGEFGRSRM